MATVIFIKEGRQNPSAMSAVINYCQQKYKTYDSKSKQRLVSGINCDGDNSFREFMATKKVHGKANGVFFYQYVQSFSPMEKITPEQAHEVAMEFAEKAWSGHEVLVTTHCDARHIHSHFVINSVGYESGMKLRQSPSTLKRLRKLSDEICKAHGFSILDPYEGGGRKMSVREYRSHIKGDSWKQKLVNDIEQAMEYSGSRAEFERAMSILGYRMTWTGERKYLTFHCPNGKSCRDKNLHDDKFLKENIENELYQREFSDCETTTGWENSRELYEQHIRERGLAKAESQWIADSYPSALNNIGTLTGAISNIVDNDTDDPDERRKRIEAEENGSALGTIIGLGIGAAANIISDYQEESSAELPDFYYEEHKTREEILNEIFGADDYDYDDYDYDDYDDSADEDEDTGFSMSL